MLEYTTSHRSRNNQASKRSYIKSLEQKFAEDYELAVVDKHSADTHMTVWHWKRVPENHLFLCGYINEFSEHRKKRLARFQEPCIRKCLFTF